MKLELNKQNIMNKCRKYLNEKLFNTEKRSRVEKNDKLDVF